MPLKFFVAMIATVVAAAALTMALAVWVGVLQPGGLSALSIAAMLAALGAAIVVRLR